MVFDPQLLAEVFECVVIKLLSIFRDKDFKDSEATNDDLPHEALNVLLNDCGQGFYFNPFSEVVDSYDEELELRYCHKEGSYNVESLLGEGPWGIHRSELL